MSPSRLSSLDTVGGVWENSRPQDEGMVVDEERWFLLAGRVGKREGPFTASELGVRCRYEPVAASLRLRRAARGTSWVPLKDVAWMFPSLWEKGVLPGSPGFEEPTPPEPQRVVSTAARRPVRRERKQYVRRLVPTIRLLAKPLRRAAAGPTSFLVVAGTPTVISWLLGVVWIQTPALIWPAVVLGIGVLLLALTRTRRLKGAWVRVGIAACHFPLVITFQQAQIDSARDKLRALANEHFDGAAAELVATCSADRVYSSGETMSVDEESDRYFTVRRDRPLCAQQGDGAFEIRDSTSPTPIELPARGPTEEPWFGTEFREPDVIRGLRSGASFTKTWPPDDERAPLKASIRFPDVSSPVRVDGSLRMPCAFASFAGAEGGERIFKMRTEPIEVWGSGHLVILPRRYAEVAEKIRTAVPLNSNYALVMVFVMFYWLVYGFLAVGLLSPLDGIRALLRQRDTLSM